MIDQIYDELKRLGCVGTHAEFAANFLGRNARHFDFLRCTGSQPSIETLARLAARLEATAIRLRLGGRWIDEAARLSEISSLVWSEIQERSLRPRGYCANPLRASLIVL